MSGGRLQSLITEQKKKVQVAINLLTGYWSFPTIFFWLPDTEALVYHHVARIHHFSWCPRDLALYLMTGRKERRKEARRKG
jgi:hypothetical protein